MNIKSTLLKRKITHIGFAVAVGLQVLTGRQIASAITIITDRDLWEDAISVPLVTEDFDSEELPSGFMNLTEKTTFSSGLSIVPQGPLDITYFYV